MTHLVDALRGQAEEAMESMRRAARRARDLHARAELMRHMLTTAGKVAHRPRREAVAYVVHHWMQAWGIDPADCPQAQQMERFAGAFHDYACNPGDAQDAAVRAAAEALEEAFTAVGMPLADQMAWRSECAHAWWAQVSPPPAGFGPATGNAPREPFWDRGCPAHCLEQG